MPHGADYAYARQSLAAAACKIWYLGIETAASRARRAVSRHLSTAARARHESPPGRQGLGFDVVDTRAKLKRP